MSLWPLAPSLAASKIASEYILDLSVAARGKLGHETKGSKKLKIEIIRFYLQSEPNDRLLIVAHSRGAIETKVALASGLPKCVTDRVITMAVAPAAYIEEGTCRGIQHLISPLDYVPWFSKVTADRANVTSVPGVGRIEDHSFLSPVYGQELENRLERFGIKYAPMD